MSDDKAQAIERANSYRQMMTMWAWKDLEKRLKDEKLSRLSKLMSQKGTDDLETTRGFVAALDFMENEIGFILGDVGG